MNRLFRKWINEAVERMNGEFTSASLLENIISKNGNRMYIGTSSAIGWILSRLPNVEKVRDGVYRRKRK